MIPTPWTAPALTRVDEQPATYAGLLTAVRIADHAAALIASPSGASRRSPALLVRDSCADARDALESAAPRTPAPAVPLGLLARPDDPAGLRALHPLLLACIDLATEVLDNEDEPLDIGQVTAIGHAVTHLDGARHSCWEVAG